MINFKKAALSAIAVLGLNLGTAFAGNTADVREESSTTTEIVAAKKTDCMVTDMQVINYLNSYGYSRVRVLYWTSDCTAICDTAYPYNTAVVTNGASIGTHYDMPTKK